MKGGKFYTPMDSGLKAPISDSASGADLNSAGHVYTWESGSGPLTQLLAVDFPGRVLQQGQFPGSRSAKGGVAGREYSGTWADAPSREPDSSKGTTTGRKLGPKR